MLNDPANTGPCSNREWKYRPARIRQGIVTAPKHPADANAGLIPLTDERGAMVTSNISFQS